MELRELIDAGTEKIGSQRRLAEYLGVIEQNLTAAKNGRRGLRADACGKLADLLGIDRFAVVAASELVTEKDPHRQAYFRPFVSGIARPVWMLIAATGITFVSPAPAEAAPNKSAATTRICIMSSLRARIMRTFYRLHSIGRVWPQT